MKYAELAIGLLIGTALGGSIVALSSSPAGAAASHDDIRAVVLDVIKSEPKAIIDSLNAYSEQQRADQTTGMNEALKNPEVHDYIYKKGEAPFVGPENSDKVVVEFFDYNCPACKMQFGELDKLIAANKDVKVIFMEYPIFGPQSDTNSKIGIAVHQLAPEKYFEFHSKMMKHEGRADQETALAFVKELGLDPNEVQKYSAKGKPEEILANKRNVGKLINISGTPTLIVGDKVIPYAMRQADLEAALKGEAPAAE